MKLVEGFDSNYRYVLVAARRARQIQNGARPVLEPHSRKPCRIAEEEIQAGKVKWEIPPTGAAAPMEAASEPQDGPVGGEADD
jgi:DNA-directed RNA polymerase subunit omega